MRRITPNPYRNDSEIREFSQVIESAPEYRVDFSLTAMAKGETCDSVTWESKGSQSMTITNKALASSVASANASSANSGYAMIKVAATFSDGTTDIQYIEINVHNPEYRIYG